MSVVTLFVVVLAASLVGTGLLRRYALRRNIIDVPNDRSSHLVPTPRGGGVAIVLTFLAGLAVLVAAGLADPRTAAALAGAGAIVALVGFLDDHGHVAARWRLLAHFAAALWALVALGGLPPMAALGTTIDLGWMGDVLGVIALVWLLNLYNFMDGIDGIAGVETLAVCVGAILVHRLRGGAEPSWIIPALLAIATLGFLAWNLPPARIFMGDAGSGFLGIALGILALGAAHVSPTLLWSWIILLGIFTVDATVTLLRRLQRGERIYEAHRSHGYQHAAARWGSHGRVSLMVGAINVVWLWPWAALAGVGRVDGLAAATIAYLPLVALALRLRAGVR